MNDQELRDALVVYCENHGIDVHAPEEIWKYRKEIWNDLQNRFNLDERLYKVWEDIISEDIMRTLVRTQVFQ